MFLSYLSLVKFPILLWSPFPNQRPFFCKKFIQLFSLSLSHGVNNSDCNTIFLNNSVPSCAQAELWDWRCSWLLVGTDTRKVGAKFSWFDGKEGLSPRLQVCFSTTLIWASLNDIKPYTLQGLKTSWVAVQVAIAYKRRPKGSWSTSINGPEFSATHLNIINFWLKKEWTYLFTYWIISQFMVFYDISILCLFSVCESIGFIWKESFYFSQDKLNGHRDTQASLHICSSIQYNGLCFSLFKSRWLLNPPISLVMTLWLLIAETFGFGIGSLFSSYISLPPPAAAVIAPSSISSQHPTKHLNTLVDIVNLSCCIPGKLVISCALHGIDVQLKLKKPVMFNAFCE